MTPALRQLTLGVLVAAMIAAAAGDATADSTPARRDALVFLRVLAYDKQLTRRAGEAVVIAVVYPAQGSAAAAERDGWLAALAAVKRIKVAGLPVVVVAMPYESAAGFERRLADLGPAAVIVCGGLGGAVADLRASTRRHKVLSFSRDERDARAGLAVAVVSGAERDQIVVNLAAARAEGAVFGAGLLQLAHLVEDK